MTLLNYEDLCIIEKEEEELLPEGKKVSHSSFVVNSGTLSWSCGLDSAVVSLLVSWTWRQITLITGAELAEQRAEDSTVKCMSSPKGSPL